MKISEMTPGMVFQVTSSYSSTIEMIVMVTSQKIMVISLCTVDIPRLLNVHVNTSEIYNGWERLA